MNRKALASILCASALALSACGGDDGGKTGDDDSGMPPAGGATYTYVVSQLDLGTINSATTPKTAPGFNLDASETNACGDGIEDFQSGAPDNVTGVDNQLIGVAAGISQASAELDIAQLLQEGVTDGNILLLFEVSGVDDLTTDESVSFKVFLAEVPGSGEGDAAIAPMSAGGALTANQTFDYTTAPIVTGVTGSIAGGRLKVAVSNLPLSVPALGQSLDLAIKSAEARFDITATTLSNGVIGGKLAVSDVLTQVEKFSDSLPGGEGTLGLVETVLNGAADLDKSGDACTSISAAIKFSGVKATKGAAL